MSTVGGGWRALTGRQTIGWQIARKLVGRAAIWGGNGLARRQDPHQRVSPSLRMVPAEAEPLEQQEAMEGGPSIGKAPQLGTEDQR